jgi:hypothetical protein
MMKIRMATWVLMLLILPRAALAVSTETFNGCQGTLDDPCVRIGSCEIQGAVWDQDVTIDRSSIFDTQGWPGVCDMVHVALVQGDCEPAGAKVNVTVHLSATTFAAIPSIVGPLACAGDPAPALLSFDDPGSHGDVLVGSFGDVAYAVINSGQLGATNVAFSGLAGDWSLAGGSCGATITAGGDCTIIVRFTPSSAGASADTLLLDYDDGAGPAATVQKGVSGNGTQPSVPAVRGATLWLLVAGLFASGVYHLRRLLGRPAGT